METEHADLETIARIRALAAADFHPERWRELCERLAELPPAPEVAGLIEEIEPLLKDWPDEWRATMCGLSWDERMMRGELNPRHRIVRYLRYDSVFIGRYGSIMVRSPDVVGSRMGGLRGSRALAHVKRLNLKGQRRLGDEGADAMANAEMPRLERLDLSGCGLSAVGVGAIAGAPWARQIVELALEGLHDPEAVAVLAGAFPRLSSLSLQDCAIDEAAAERLAGAPWTELVRLDVGGGLRTGAVLERLARAAPAVRDLRLRDASLDAPAIEALSGFGRLDALNLAGGMEWSSESKRYVSKTALTFDRATLEQIGVAWARVRGLGLERRGIDADAVRGWSRAASNPAELRIDHNPIGQQGLDAILSNPDLRALSAGFIGTVERVKGRGLHENRTAHPGIGCALDRDLGGARHAPAGPSVESVRARRPLRRRPRARRKAAGPRGAQSVVQPHRHRGRRRAQGVLIAP